MSSINLVAGKPGAFIKGAPDVLVEKCSDANWDLIKHTITKWSAKGYRVIAVATKELVAKNKFDEKTVEKGMKFLGLVAMYDPPRSEVYSAVQQCIKAGIKPIMITGDHIDTAVAIAKEVGIFRNGDKAISGSELKEMSDKELALHVAEYSVYARVSPEDKLKIVKAWQANDQVVAMTGDGVNDAPALKAADIGCAMGITGTDVAKEAADMVLMDDNFKTIVAAVDNGRKVYQTIKRVIQNILLSSIAEIIIMLLGIIIFRYAYPDVLATGLDTHDLHIFGASQLLLINLVTDGFPAIALGLQGTTDNLMNRRPYSKFESIFARRMGGNWMWQGCLFWVLSLVAFTIGVEYSKNHWFNNQMLESLTNNGLNSFYAGSACAFITLGVGVSIHALSLMTNDSVFKTNIKKSWIVYCAVWVSILIIFFVTFIPPVALVFGMPSSLISEGGFLIVIALIFSIIPLFIMELIKLAYRIILQDALSITTITSFEMIRRPIRRKLLFRRRIQVREVKNAVAQS